MRSIEVASLPEKQLKDKVVRSCTRALKLRKIWEDASNFVEDPTDLIHFVQKKRLFHSIESVQRA